MSAVFQVLDYGQAPNRPKVLSESDGLYFTFLQASTDDEKSYVLRRYQLLPYWDWANLGCYDPTRDTAELSTDPGEYDVMRKVLDVCARLAVVGSESSRQFDGGRKPSPQDLESIKELVLTDSGAILRVSLSGSTWYRNFLYHAIDIGEHAPGDRLAIPIPPLHYDANDALPKKTWCGLPGCGSFGYPETISEEWFKDNPFHDKGYEYSQKKRANFLAGKNYPFRYWEGNIALWDDETLTVIAHDYDGAIDAQGLARILAHELLSLHTSAIQSAYSFEQGWIQAAESSICALWADFALCVARKPLTICWNCGKPILSNSPPRGHRRKFCPDSQSCSKQYKRKCSKLGLNPMEYHPDI